MVCPCRHRCFTCKIGVYTASEFSSLKQALKSYFSSIMLQGCSIILEIYKWMLNITLSIDAIYMADILATNFVIRWSFMLFLIPEEMTRNLVQKFNIPFLKIYFIQVVSQLRNLEWVSDARSHSSLLRFPGIIKVNGYTCRFTAGLELLLLPYFKNELTWKERIFPLGGKYFSCWKGRKTV